MEPLKIKMNNTEFKKRMKDLEKEDQKKIDEEKIANDAFLKQIGLNKSVN